MCVWERGREWERVCVCQVCVILIAAGYLLTYDTPPACLDRWLLLSSCENQAYTNTGKNKTHWTMWSIPLIDSTDVRVCVWFSGVCHAQPILWKSLSRSTSPSLPFKACKWDEELYHFPRQVGTVLKSTQFWCQIWIKSGKSFFTLDFWVQIVWSF